MSKLLSVAREVIEVEIAGLAHIASNLDEQFEIAVDKILSADGRVIVCGMGKSGIIGKKIVASLASTGTPSFFMHPAEAFHGDLGMIKSQDVFLAISNSGETDEVLKLLPFLRDSGNFLIAMTGNENSTLAVNAHCHLDVGVEKEACPLQLAPTASTTATLAMGDALTVALMEAREFRAENFARFHPGGSLGRRLLCKVRDEMVCKDLPYVSSDTSSVDVLNSITSGQLGLAIVMDEDNLTGLITDGDLRRSIEQHGQEFFSLKAIDMLSRSPRVISPDASMQQAIEFMEQESINALIVIDGESLVGVLKK